MMPSNDESYFHSYRGMLHFGVNNSPWLSGKDGEEISLEDVLAKFEFKNVRIDIIDTGMERDKKLSNRRIMYGYE